MTEVATVPLHALLARLQVGERAAARGGWSFPLGSMQILNDCLAGRPFGGFLNATLRGVGQCMFLNNPVSGALALAALAIQSPWLALMGGLGAAAGTAAAQVLRLDPGALQNGIYGLNGFLIGALLAVFGGGDHAFHPLLMLLSVGFGAMAAYTLERAGGAFAKRVGVPPVGLVSNALLFPFLAILTVVPQTLFHVGPATEALPAEPADAAHLIQSIVFGLGQVLFSGERLSVALVLVAVVICSPLTLLLGLAGSATAVVAALLFASDLGPLYAGFWGWNAALTAIAVGGIFFAPTTRSVALGLAAAFAASLFTIGVGSVLGRAGLPLLSIPFFVATVTVLKVTRHAQPSLVPVALHAITTPEEHRRRLVVSRDIIENFRADLAASIEGRHRTALYDRATPEARGMLDAAFDAIDTDGSGEVSFEELAGCLGAAESPVEEGALRRLFTGFDHDESGSVSRVEFGELLLRHARLMGIFEEFATYFLPIDVDGDDAISVKEMNIAMRSVGQSPLTPAELGLVQRRHGDAPLLWNQFLELVLVA